jgi:O-antigen/teichoic acid export membrane protein
MLKEKFQRLQQKLRDKDLKEIFNGSTIAFFYRVTGAALSFYLLKLIADRFGNESLGIYNLFTNNLALLALAGGLGFNTSILRYIAQYWSQGQFEKIKKLYKGILTLIIPLSVIMAALIFFMADEIAAFIYHKPILAFAIKISAITLPFLVIKGMHVEFIRGLKKIKYSEYLRNLNQPLINTIIIFLAGITFFSFFNFPELPLLGFGVGIILSVLFSLGVIFNFFSKNESKIKETHETQFSLKEHLLVSSPMILTSFAQIIHTRMGLEILGEMSSIENVAAYGTAARLAILTTFIQMSVNTISATKFSELFWNNKFEELNKVISFSTRMVFLVSFPVVIVLMLFPKSLLYFIHPDLIIASQSLMILALAQFISAGAGSVGTFLNMTGNQKVFRNIIICSTTLNILLNIILIPYFDLMGTAIANLVSVSFWNISGAVYIYKKYKIKTFYIPFM